MSRRVIVVGGGMAGLVTAIAAAERGAQVTALEAGPAVGGSMAISGGLVWSPATLEDARRWIPRGDERLQRIVVDEIAPGWEWLESHGLPLHPKATCMKHGFGHGRLMAMGDVGARQPFADTMAASARELGAEVVVSARVTGVSRDGEHWTVTWTGDGGEHGEEAEAVVFAAGGFHNSKELVSRFITTYPEELVIRGNRQSDGVAIRSLTPLGAELSRGMHSFYGHTFPWAKGHEWDTKDFLPATMFYTDYCVLLNQLGLRFKDESVGVVDEHSAQVGSRQPGGRYYTVFDERIRRDYVDADLVGIPGLPTTATAYRIGKLEQFGTKILKADDIDSLAAAMEREFDVPAVNILDSIKTFNEASDPIRDLEPPRRESHTPLVEAPFWAIPSVAAITYTMGGLRVNEDMSVRGLGGTVFAAGADAGNVYEDVYGGGLGWGLVSGRRAGAAAAGEPAPVGVAAAGAAAA